MQVVPNKLLTAIVYSGGSSQTCGPIN